MNTSCHDRLRGVPAAVERITTGLFREMAPKMLFFFCVFGLMFLIFKLFAEQYSIEFSVFTRAAVAALILAKVISLLDWVESGYRLATYRRIVVVIGKTLVYATAVIVIGIGDRIFEAARKHGGLRAGVAMLVANANIDRFLGLVLLISLVVGTYLSLQEIDRAMGKGALMRLFFVPPANCTTRPSTPPSGGLPQPEYENR